MATSHTPGPWYSEGLSEVRTGDYLTVLRAAPGIDHEQAVANATLAAAAPDLMAALDRIADSDADLRPGHPRYLSKGQMVEIARNALTKAGLL